MNEVDQLAIVVREGDAATNGNGNEAIPELAFALTDTGNAQRFKHRFGNVALYCSKEEYWRVYDGIRWIPDDTQQVYRWADDVVAQIPLEADTAPTSEAQTALRKYAVRSQSLASLHAMVKSAARFLPVTRQQFDTDPCLFNVQNGTLDLRTGELQPHSRDDLITKLSPITYDPSARSPLWDEFLNRCIPSKPVAAFLQRWFGYCMTGLVHEHALVFAWGAGANGKSVCTAAISHVMGDYARATQPETIMRRERKDLSPDVADLEGARFVPTQEIEEGSRFQEGLLKQITGGDVISARRLYQDFVNFRPTFKLWITGNDRPLVGNGKAIWRRLLLVPFTVEIPKEEQDPHLEEKLKGEASGILNWMLEGCRQWRELGLAPPSEVLHATAKYRAEVDDIGRFLREKTVDTNPEARVTADDLFHAYKEWAANAGIQRPLNQTRFGMVITQRGYEKGPHDRSRRIVYFGLGLLNEDLERLEQEQFPESVTL